MDRFANCEQFKAFLKKETKRLNLNITTVYSTYMARTILERLSKINDDSILVKGSSAEIAYLGRLVRAITDIDLASVEKFNDNVGLIYDLFHDKNNDQLNISFNKRIYQTKTGIYKLSLNCEYEKIKQPIGIDFQENYSRLIEPNRRIMPKIFEGDKEFEIYCPSFEEYLAEKLCIIIESNKEDVLNTRVKDFYDIYQLHGGIYDPDKLTEYFGKMIKLRNKIKIEDAKTLNLNGEFIEKHNPVWESTRKKYDFIDEQIDLAGAVYYTRAVLREQLQKNGKKMENNIPYLR